MSFLLLNLKKDFNQIFFTHTLYIKNTDNFYLIGIYKAKLNL